MAKALDTNDVRVLNKIGAFSSLYDIKFKEYKNPVLVLKTEEPGSKQLLAAKYGKLENVSYDMINHLINDCIVMGARPLTVQDAIICGKMNKDDVNKIVKAVADACKRQTSLFDALVEAKRAGKPTVGRIITCQHPHVYTIGRSGKEQNMLMYVNGAYI